MTDDAGRGRLGGVPAHGSAGPVDPHADPVTDPGMRVAVPAEQPDARAIGDARQRITPAARPGDQQRQAGPVLVLEGRSGDVETFARLESSDG